MAYDRNKFKSLVHYICWRCDRERSKLGSVKLNKALWLSDLLAYYKFNEPITGVRYVKRQFGPVPKPILPVLAELEEAGVLTIRDAKYFGRQKKEYIVHKEATSAFMSEDERDIVEDIIRFVCEEHTAASISHASHDHIWKAALDGEELPHYTVFARPGEITEDDREWANMVLGKEMAAV
jgi:hypothetical protein